MRKSRNGTWEQHWIVSTPAPGFSNGLIIASYKDEDFAWGVYKKTLKIDVRAKFGEQYIFVPRSA